MFHLTFFSASMGGDPFWGFTLVSILVIPSDIAGVLCIRYVKRRVAVLLTFLGTGIFILLLIPFGEGE